MTEIDRTDPPPENPDDPRDTARMKAVFVVIAALAFFVSPLFNDPFTGFEPGQMPVAVAEPPVTPAGYAFAIWGVIYLWLVASALFGLIKRDTAEDWDATRWPLFMSLAVGASWIPIALTSPVLATILIWAMWAGAVWALLRAPTRDRSWLAWPLGLYAGWLTAASSVATATVVMGYGLLPPMAASWAGLLLALCIALPLSQRLRTPTYAFAAGWAAVGIVVANWPTLYGFAAAAGALLLLGQAARQGLALRG
ncbi:hypothetical protein roselon_00264 [Roseibacterium elongatum DSM 19469]|uniref:Tryptophan-rich sensory protein n=1 Tax=Roseicyclus elongatus DSM 19469 TaxID=1294273 RepID=W8RNJ0_9RHOB|nr:tryptophan-rich sensory protein [Roseibacterium elongatum]AHM02719.1 hypothetical protein roselon_00264 [Roseibacterium elongatum DSM 19469]